MICLKKFNVNLKAFIKIKLLSTPQPSNISIDFNRFTEQKEKVYSINLKLIIDQLVTLTHIHSVKIEKVSGLITDVANMIEYLQACTKTSQRCVHFFQQF